MPRRAELRHPPTQRSITLVVFQSQRDKGNREEGLKESERKGASLEQVLEEC